MFINIIDSTILSEGIIKNFNKYLPNTIFYFNGSYTGSECNVISTNFSKEENLMKIVDEINNHKQATVIFHFMNSQKRFILNNLNDYIKKVWCIWGYDLYEANASFIRFSIYDTITQKYIIKNRNLLTETKSFIKKISYTIQTNSTPKKRFKNDLKNFDAISYIVPEEEKIINKLGFSIPSLLLYHDPTYLEFTPIEKMEVNNKNNILIGNSGALSNNHLDAFELLINEDIGDRKIIVPLSYGGNKKYIDYVIKKGFDQFGENFLPVINRLPLKEYSKLLEGCGIVIFNHKRQQGVGNLLSLIGRGSKIIFNPENPVFTYYKSYGLYLENINNFTLNTLTLNQVIENQHVIKNIYNEDKLIKEFEKLKLI